MENATFWEHFAELRKTLIQVLFIVILGIVCALFYHQEIFHILTRPLQERSFERFEVHRERILNSNTHEIEFSLPPNSKVISAEQIKQINAHTFLIPPGASLDIENVLPINRLILLSPLEGMMTTFKISFWIGFVATSPLWLCLILRFISPALRDRERKPLPFFIALTLIFFFLGILFAYFITIPFANQYLQTFNSEIGYNQWALANYLDYTIVLLLANALAFELMVILFFLVHHGFLSPEGMVSKRRHMIVLAFILGALLTPPDVLTQVLLAVPLIIFYELAILYAKARVRIHNKKIKV